MKRFLFLILAGFMVAASSKAEDTLYLFGFKGLNTSLSPEFIAPNEASICHNFSLSRGGLGTLMLRQGHDSVAHKSGQDSLVGLISLTNDDETRRLLLLGDSSGVGWGYIYACPINTRSVSSATRLNWAMPVAQQPSGITYLGNTYVVNGGAYGVQFPDKHPELAKPFPLQPPGSPYVVPIKGTGNLNGTVRYALIFYKTGFGLSDTVATISGDPIRTAPYFGVLTRAVTVSGQNVRLSNFELPTKQQLGSTTRDTCRIILLRTLGLTEPLDPATDSMYYIVDTLRLDSANYSTFTYTDTSSDATLLANGAFDTPDQRELWGTAGLYLDGDPPIELNHIALGAPTFVNFGGVGTGADSGIWDGSGFNINGNSLIAGWIWVCTYVDTATGNESDTGATWMLRINLDAGLIPLTEQMVFQLPRSPVSGVRVRIYRAPIERVGRDSTLRFREIKEADLVKFNPNLQILKEFSPSQYRELISKLLKRQNGRRNYISDTMVAYRYYLLGEAEPGSAFTDSLPYDSLLNRDRMRVPFFPQEPRKILVSNNRFYILSTDRTGDKLWISLPDTVYARDVLSFQNFKSETGTHIVDAWANRFGVAIKKYVEGGQMFDVDTKVEPTQAYGSMSPNGHVKVQGLGDLYVARTDVVLEAESETLERQYGSASISQQLSNFRKLSPTVLSKAVAGYSPNTEQALFSIGDTIYCWDKRVGGWSTWTGFTFNSTAIFGADSSRTGIPSDTMLFLKPGSSTLFRFGYSQTDKGSNIQQVYRTGGLFADDARDKSIEAFGINWTSVDTGTFGFSVYNQANALQVSHAITDPATDEYREAAFESNNSLWSRFGFATTGFTADSTIIKKITLFYSRNQAHRARE